MISFYPGPSRVHDEIPKYVKEACKDGILSINHRSEEFMKISERTIRLLRQRLGVPRSYTVFFTSSATECWEIIAQSLVIQKSYHLYNGAFGKKWFDYTKRIRPEAQPLPFHPEDAIDPGALRFDSENAVICLTQNETSNGTQVNNTIIRSIKQKWPDHLVAIDATSSMAGIKLDFNAADIWFASVQKCFGLPAGLGLMICSPKAIKHAMEIGEHDHYNSLTFMAEMMNKWQTPYTPNVLNIYLLMRVLEASKPIATVHEKVEERYHQWVAFLKESKRIHHLIGNPDVRSYTVIPVAAAPQLIVSIKKKARKNGLLLGEGYGDLKNTTFRIANFPAIKKQEVEKLKKFLRSFL